MGRLRQVVATVTTVAVVGLSAACGGDNPKPSSGPSASPPTESSRPTASATLPARDPGSSEDSRRGAATFVEYYIETLNYASRTGETDAAEALAAPGCRSCSRVIDSIQRVYAGDGEVRGGAWRPNPVSAVRTDAGWVVDVNIEFEPQSIVRSRGEPAEKYPGGRGTASFTVKREGSDWLVDQWTRA
ncbi:DUF6318 family protein [Nocardioides aurantiacus]|uniref:DUF6318 family protein n=1 Tax=Nocardioides aurantiacus TaxID=86796 RepID=UPI00403F9806